MNRIWVAVAVIVITGGGIALATYYGSGPPGNFGISVGQPSVDYTTIGANGSYAHVIESETFPVSITLPHKVNASLEVSGLAEGVWVRFEPASLLDQGPGTVIVKMLLAGTVQPFTSTPSNTTSTIDLVLETARWWKYL